MTNPHDPEQKIHGEPATAAFSVPDEAPKTATGKHKGWLSKAFSIAATAGAGMGVGFAVKTCAISALCTVGAPAAVTAIVACAATGLIMGTGKALWRHYQEKKNGSTEAFWSKKTGRTILFNTLVSSVAGSLAFTFSDQIADVAGDLYDKAAELINGPATVPPVIPDLPPQVVTTPPPELAPPPEVPALPEMPQPETAPPEMPAPQPEPLEPPAPPQEMAPPEEVTPPIQPEEPVAPEDTAPPADTDDVVPPPESNDAPPPTEEIVLAPSALDKIAALAADGHISALAQQTLERAQAGNPQAIKDLGYFTFNGFQGFAESHELGVELFQQAADLGNVQAKVDLAYVAYHGLGGVDADPGAAYGAMKDLAANDSRARDFVKAWDGMRPTIMAAAVPAP